MTIEAVIFDFGGVFTSSPFTGLHQWHVDKGLDPVKGLRIVFGPYDQDTDHPWHRVERGEIALEAAAEQIKALAAESGMDLDLREMFGALGGADGARQDVVEIALDLRRRGYRTALITNNIAEFSDGWRAMIPVEEIFEVVVDSSAIGIRKPDLRIYELTLEQLGVAPEVSVFLDDAAGNIDAARAAGMHAILVGDDHTIAFAELAELLATAP
jgi:epoxide hydrolase-like predicted phosphatase